MNNNKKGLYSKGWKYTKTNKGDTFLIQDSRPELMLLNNVIDVYFVKLIKNINQHSLGISADFLLEK